MGTKIYKKNNKDIMKSKISQTNVLYLPPEIKQMK